MAHFAKPAEGSWTEHYPELGTGPVSYEDSISPDHYELERKAIFARTWLNVGRMEQLPRKGSYFTKELDAAGTSLVIVRGTDDEVHAFHNICRHRGNKLVWNDYPGEETSGTCRQFTCKYHGWRYATEGQLTFVQQESEFFDLDKDRVRPGRGARGRRGRASSSSTSTPTTPRRSREYLGEFGAGIAGYPFGEMTQVYKYRADVGANWKLFIDAFAEFYHAPILHAKQATAEESRKLSGYGFEALAYKLDGPHGMVSSWGGMSPPKDLDMVKPIERVLKSGLFGPWDQARHRRPGRAAAVGQPVPPPVLGRRFVRVLPQLHAAHLGAGLVPDLPLLADLLQHPHLRGHLVLRAAEDRQRASGAGAGRCHLQGVRPPGRQHPGGDADHARDPGGHRVPPQRPGDPPPPPAQDGAGLRERLPEQVRHAGAHLERLLAPIRDRLPTQGQPHDDPPRRVRRPRALRRLVARDRGRTLREASGQHHGRAPDLLRHRLPQAGRGHGLSRPARSAGPARRRQGAALAAATRW